MARQTGDPTKGDLGLHTCSDGTVLAVKRLSALDAAKEALDVEERGNIDVAEDARLLNPRRSWASVARVLGCG